MITISFKGKHIKRLPINNVKDLFLEIPCENFNRNDYNRGDTDIFVFDGDDDLPSIILSGLSSSDSTAMNLFFNSLGI